MDIIVQNDNSILLKPHKIKLDEMLSEIKDDNLHPEHFDDVPKGKENW